MTVCQSHTVKVTAEGSLLSGPAVVTFTGPSALITTATFSVEDVYAPRLTASDSGLSNSDLLAFVPT